MPVSTSGTSVLSFPESGYCSARIVNVKIEVAPDRLALVEARFIDGQECLVVTVNDRVEVDGMNVRTIGFNEREG